MEARTDCSSSVGSRGMGRNMERRAHGGGYSRESWEGGRV